MDFKLEPWRPALAQSLAAAANDQDIAAYLRDAFPHPYTPADAEAFIAQCVQSGDASGLFRAITLGDEAVGSISVIPGSDVYRRSAELGYFLAKPWWGQGLMTWAVQRITAEAFSRYDICRIYAEPFAHNFGSRRVLEKTGFALEGTLYRSVCKNGQMYDSCIYALTR